MSNIEKFKSYLNGNEQEKNFAYGLIKRGHVFVAYQVGDSTHFIPSRYVGYKENDISKHKDIKKNGTATTGVINKILGKNTNNLEQSYIKFCEEKGITPSQHKRTYWTIDNLVRDIKVIEGFSQEVNLNIKTRSRTYIDAVKERDENTCQVCGYQKEINGRSVIHVHHKIPLKDITETSLENLICLCPNCHYMAHFQQPPYTIQKLKEIINS